MLAKGYKTHSVMNRVTVILAVGVLASGAGCGRTNDQFVTPDRLGRGLVVVLPGIEGEGPLSYAIRDGVLDGGVQSAVPIYRWGRPIPLAGPLLNQTGVIGNRLAGERIAQMIADYQDSHPGRPVYVVGHSGGGGVAVFAAESLPDGCKVEGLVLLSASISKGYDLNKALAHCRRGIINYYSSRDVGLLGVGTTLVGNVDGRRGPSAGLSGFDRPFPGLKQVAWTRRMAAHGNHGSHTDSASRAFVRHYVAPFLRGGNWPND
jgi:pimeloyl-ACP methyl ester carboxylesterase